MTELKTMKVSVNEVHEVVKVFRDLNDEILEIIVDLANTKLPVANYAIKHNDHTYALRFEQTVLMSDEEASAITEAFQTAVRKIDIFLNNHSLGCIHLTIDDIQNGLNEADKSYVIQFITAQIAKLAFNQWYWPNVGNPGFGFSNLSDYIAFVKSMLGRVKHDAQINWDGRICNFSVYLLEPFEVKVQQTHYCNELGYLDEDFLLGSVRTTIHAVFFELFRKKQLGENVVVDINYVE